MCLAIVRGSWKELEGAGRSSKELEGAGRSSKELEGAGNVFEIVFYDLSSYTRF